MGDYVDNQEWIIKYDNLRSDFQGKRKISANLNANDAKGFNDRLAVLEKHLNIMKESPMEYDITVSEIGRRQFIIENMKKQLAAASAGSDSKLYSMSSAAQDSNNQAPTFNPMTTSDQGLVQRQKEVIKMQDNMLLDIEKGVDRLQIQAKEINQEAKVHTKILEDLDTHVDEATDKLKEETKHAELIKARTNDCYAYLCIVLEVIILIIMLVFMFTKM